MRLCFPKDYDSFTDTEHFMPHLEELKKSYEETMHNADTDLQARLNRMEDLQELMRYYAWMGDYDALEPVMRAQADYLDKCRVSGVNFAGNSTGFVWLEMAFAQLNAQLFIADKDAPEARNYYQEAVSLAKKSFSCAIDDNTLSDEQRLYIGWSCAEIMQEAASINSAEMLSIYHTLIPILEYLEPLMQDYILIRDKTAELYLAIAGVLFQYGETTDGGRLFAHASEMFKELYHTYVTDVHLVRSIWADCLYSLQVLTTSGNTELLLRCESEAERAKHAITTPREQNILQAVLGLIASQKSIPLQVSGQIEQAAALSKQGCQLLVQALGALEQEQTTDSYIQTVLSNMLIRICHGYAAALDLLGVQYISLNRPQEAKDAFEKILILLREEQQKLADTDLSVMRAEALQYLALIAFVNDEGAEGEYYGKAAVKNAFDAAERTNLSAAWAIAIMSCSIMAEYYIKQKEKTKAAQYADTGLSACEKLYQIDPSHEQLTLSHTLEKFKKKAARRFF